MSISVFCLSGIAAVVVRIPGSFADSGVGNRPSPATSATAPKTRTGPVPVAESAFVDSDCADCGLIESNRVVDTSGKASARGDVGDAMIRGVVRPHG